MQNYDYIELGTSPTGENCVQVEPSGAYLPKMRAECEKFRDMLEKKFPEVEEASAFFKVKSFPHDFGTYYEVVICYDPDEEKAYDLAYFIEANTPEFWSEIEPIYSTTQSKTPLADAIKAREEADK